MFLQKQKCVKTFQRLQFILDKTFEKNIENLISIKINISKKYSSRMINHSIKGLFSQTDDLNIKLTQINYSFIYLSKKHFCILEKIQVKEYISLDEFSEFVTNFQKGEIQLSEFPKKYKKFLKEIKLLPGEPDEPEDCCGKDCSPCVIEFYHEKLDKRLDMINNVYRKIYPELD